MTFDEYRQQIIDFIGFEPGDPAGYAYKKEITREELSLLPWSSGSQMTYYAWEYYDADDQLLYSFDYSDYHTLFEGHNTYPLFPHLPVMMKYRFIRSHSEYVINRYLINDSVPTIHYAVMKYSDACEADGCRSVTKHFDWQIER